MASRASFFAVSFFSVIALATVLGCSASGNDAGTTTSADGGNPATGGGGNGGDAEGGSGGGGGFGLCDMDCSEIAAPVCHIALCNDGMYPGAVGVCVVVPDEDGSSCDDQQFCTVNDSCLAGVCTGGPPNTCNLPPMPCQEATCNEVTQMCEYTAADDGSVCQPNGLCEVNGSAPAACASARRRTVSFRRTQNATSRHAIR